MKLYMHAAACSLSPHIVCRELGLPIELIEVDRKTRRTLAGEDFLRINPNGYVPVLELEDGERLMEGPAIVQYLADLRPEAGLLPTERTLARPRVQSWLNFITSELHKPLAMRFDPAYAPAKQTLLGHVEKRLKWLSGQIAEPYLAGEGFTVADAYLFVCLNWSPFQGIDLTRWPQLALFMARVGARPKVQEALTAEDLLPHGAEGIFYAPRAYLCAQDSLAHGARA